MQAKETERADVRSPADEFRDETGAIREDFLNRVSDAIRHHDSAILRDLVGELHEADTGDLIEALEPDLRPQLIELMGKDFDFSALTEVDDTVREEILEELGPETVAEGVRELDSDDAVYILEDLDRQEQVEILNQLPPTERVALERSLLYPEESAGRRMQTEFIAVPPEWNVGQAIDYMRETVDLPDRFYELYVVDPAGKFLGAVALDRLLRTKRPVPIVDLMDEDRRRVRATEDQEEVARQFERYNLVAAPVVDEDDRLVGVLTFDDIVDVIEQEAEEDIRALGGVTGDEELSDTVLVTSRSRLPWLVINMGTAFIAATVISFFEATIEQVVAVAFLMPVNAALGGNAGTQALTVAVRALATQELTASNRGRVIVRECLVGLVNGCALAVLAGTIAALIFGNVKLGLVLSAAMVLTVMFATTLGILVPLLLNRLKIDPAVASGVFVTTTTDVFGFFIFLSFATIMFRLV
ncbi:magnesium transporter [Pseudorhodoplanes sp.]|uniref:magnesium transporter n=1 Tax=Pseudorhodoplanes sp. TaxID=1934341 RepID=UPI003919A146